jgi:hypothetical protein
LRLKISLNNLKSKSVSLEQEKEYAEQTFRNMVWFYRKELLKIHSGVTMEQIGLSRGEIGNLKRQEILKLTITFKDETRLIGKYRNGNGRIYVLTEKAKLALREMTVSEK